MDYKIDLSHRGSNHPAMELFSCAVCGETMVDPSTLECGHNFCRLCLARWWKVCVREHRATTCPICQQRWTVVPSTNTSMRDMLERELGQEASDRRKAVLEDPEAVELLREFDLQRSRGQELIRASHHVQHGATCRIGLFLVIGFSVFIVLLIRGGSSSTQGASELPVRTWNTTRVQEWLGSLGEWGAHYKAEFEKLKIDGRLLVELTESDLADEFHMTNALHRRAILSETNHLRNLHSQSPRDFFDYKRLHRQRTMFLLWGLRCSPRWTLIYSYLYRYEDLAVPLFKLVVSGSNDIGKLPLWVDAAMPLEDDAPSAGWYKFWLWVLLLPYLLILRFAWYFIDVNFITSSVVMLYCAFLTLIELSLVKHLVFREGWKSLPKTCAESGLSALIGGAILYVVWPVIPFFICDVAFYWFLYFGPIDAALGFYKSLRR